MSTDLILAILHHLGVFTVAGVIAAELVLIRPGMSMDKILQAAKIDALYGIAAGSVLFIGFARVFFGLKGSAFYLQNPVFWAKIIAFIVCLLGVTFPITGVIMWINRTRKKKNAAVSKAVEAEMAES